MLRVLLPRDELLWLLLNPRDELLPVVSLMRVDDVFPKPLAGVFTVRVPSVNPRLAGLSEDEKLREGT